MSKPSEDYVVLRDTADHDGFVRLAKGQNWVPYRTYPRTDELSVFEDVWTTADQKTAIHFVDDPSYGVQFIRVRGDKVSEILRELARTLSFYDDEELIEDASSVETLEEGIRSILHVGVGFRNHNARALHTYRAYLQHADPDMRRAAIKAIGYHHWTEAQELLSETVANDMDPNVREFAKLVLDTSRKKHGVTRHL
jgi:hypothetical protein